MCRTHPAMMTSKRFWGWNGCCMRLLIRHLTKRNRYPRVSKTTFQRLNSFRHQKSTESIWILTWNRTATLQATPSSASLQFPRPYRKSQKPRLFLRWSSHFPQPTERILRRAREPTAFANKTKTSKSLRLGARTKVLSKGCSRPSKSRKAFRSWNRWTTSFSMGVEATTLRTTLIRNKTRRRWEGITRRKKTLPLKRSRNTLTSKGSSGSHQLQRCSA